jgi:hypothetical protein
MGDDRSTARWQGKKEEESASQSVKRVRKICRNQINQKHSLVLGAAAYVWTTLDDLLGGLVFVLLEVLHEELAELLDFALEVGGAVP